MIFFITDFVKYNFMWNGYSEKSLEEQNLIICSKQNIESYMNKSKPMDVVFLHTRKSFISWVIMYYTNSPFSHTSLVLKNNIVIEATLQGVVKTPLTEYIDNESYFLVLQPPNITDKQTEKGMQYAESTVGSGFGWYKIILIFLQVLFATSNSWRLRYSLDIYILLILLKLTNLISLNTLILITITYTIVIIFNKVKILLSQK